MKIGRIGVVALTLCVAGGFAEAALPKPASRIERVDTSESRGSRSLRWTKYANATWGNRWRQTLGRTPFVVSPYIRGY
jgi:hypothetical protein